MIVPMRSAFSASFSRSMISMTAHHRRAGDRIAAVGAAHLALAQRADHVAARGDRRDRDAAADALADAHQVGLEPFPLHGEHLAGAPVGRLHLVEGEEQASAAQPPSSRGNQPSGGKMKPAAPW